MPSTTMDANAIQKLYEVCKVSLSEKGPLSSESLDNVRAVLDMITPSDVGLECEAEAVRVWRSPRALSRKRVFSFQPSDQISSYIRVQKLLMRPAKVVRDGEMSAPCGAMVLHPGEGGGNIHALKAITPCAILDILTPPYSSEDGRHCSYFRRCPRSDPSGVLLNRTKGSEFVWLEEYQPHDNFIIRRDLYTGPALKL